MQGQFFCTVGFAQQAFYIIAVHGLFKVSAAGPNAHFYVKIKRLGGYGIKHFKGKDGKRFTLLKNLLRKLAAFKFFLPAVCKCFAQMSATKKALPFWRKGFTICISRYRRGLFKFLLVRNS